MSQAAPVNEDKFLGDLKRWGGIASVALGAVTTVLGIFGFKEGVPERMLRNQPVAASLAFILIAAGIVLAATSRVGFDEEHARIKGFKSQYGWTDDHPLRSSVWFLLTWTLVVGLLVFAFLTVGVLLREVGFTLGQRLALAAGAGFIVALALTLVWSVSNDSDTEAMLAARRTRRTLVTGGVYFAIGLLLISVQAVTLPGLALRPNLAVGLDKGELTSTFSAEGVGAGRTLAFAVLLVGDRRVELLHRVQVGAGSDGKAGSTIVTALPPERGGTVVVVVAPSDRVILGQQKDERSGDRQHILLEAVTECPGRYTLIACTQFDYVPPVSTRLKELTLTRGQGDTPSKLSFSVSAQGLKEGQRVDVAVSGMGRRLTTFYLARFAADNSKLDEQKIQVSVPARLLRLCVSAHIRNSSDAPEGGAVCHKAQNAGVASIWIPLAPD